MVLVPIKTMLNTLTQGPNYTLVKCITTPAVICPRNIYINTGYIFPKNNYKVETVRQENNTGGPIP